MVEILNFREDGKQTKYSGKDVQDTIHRELLFLSSKQDLQK